MCISSCMASPTGRCRSTIRRRPTSTTLGWERRVLKQAIENLGNHTIQGVWRIGFASRFFLSKLLHSGTAFRRFGLTIREMYFTGKHTHNNNQETNKKDDKEHSQQGYETL